MSAMCDQNRILLKPDHFPREEGEYPTVRTLSNCINYDQLKNNINSNELQIQFDNRITKVEKQFVLYLRKKLKKPKKYGDPCELATKAVSNQPNSMWAHLMNAAACFRNPEKKEFVTKALATTVLLNPNCKTAWRTLFEIYRKGGGFFKKETIVKFANVTTALLRLETDADKWAKYANEVVKYAYWTKSEAQAVQAFRLLIPYLSHQNVEIQKYVAKFLTHYTMTRKFLTPIADEIIIGFIIHLKYVIPEGKMKLFYEINEILVKNNLPFHQCEFILQVKQQKLYKWMSIEELRLINEYVKDLFYKIGENSSEAVKVLKEVNAEHFLNQRFTHHTKNPSFIHHFAAEKYQKLMDHCAGQDEFNTKKFIFLTVVEKQGCHERLFKLLVRDLFILGRPKYKSEKFDRLRSWYLKKLTLIIGKMADGGLLMLARELAYKLLELYGLNSDLLFVIGLANTVIDDEPGKHILQTLLRLGYFDSILYLQALEAPNTKSKMFYLQLMNNSMDSHLLAAQVWIKKKKSVKAKKELLLAILETDFFYIPYEILGMWYYLKNKQIQRGLSNLCIALELNPYNAIAVLFISHILEEHSELVLAKRFYNMIQGTEFKYSWAMNKIHFIAGFKFLYQPEQHYDYYNAVVHLRKCHFANLDNRCYIEMVADAYKQYGMHGSSMKFYSECYSNDNIVHAYPLAMYAIEAGQATKYARYFKFARIALYTNNKSVVALYTWASIILEKANYLFSKNNIPYAQFLLQQVILLMTRAICIYSCAPLWKALGDALFYCGKGSENIVQIFVPSWLYRRENDTTKEIVLIGKYECLILAIRCYFVGLNFCDTKNLKAEFWCSIGVACWYWSRIHVLDKDKLLIWSLCSSENALNNRLLWEPLNMYAVTVFELGEKERGLKRMKDAFEVGFTSFAKELEFNLGWMYFSLGEWQKAFDAFMFRRGFDPTDEDIWLYYAFIQSFLPDNGCAKSYLKFHYKYTKPTPTISQWYFFLAFLNKTISIKYGTVDYKAILKNQYQNKLLATIFHRSPVPHDIKEMTLIDYYILGTLHMQYGDRKFALENFSNYIKRISVKDTSKLSPSDHFELREVIAHIAKLTNEPLSVLQDMESTEATLIKYWNHLINNNSNSAYIELLDGLTNQNCKSKIDLFKAITQLTHNENFVLPKQLVPEFTGFLMHQLKKGIMFINKPEAEFMWSAKYGGHSVNKNRNLENEYHAMSRKSMKWKKDLKMNKCLRNREVKARLKFILKEKRLNEYTSKQRVKDWFSP